MASSDAYRPVAPSTASWETVLSTPSREARDAPFVEYVLLMMWMIGFRVSTAVSPRPVHHDITCGETEMSFVIPVPANVTLSQSVTLSDPRCLVDTANNLLSGKTMLNDCGTTVSFTNDSVLFSNFLLLTPQNDSADMECVVRIECSYNRTMDAHLGYLPVIRQVLFTERGVGHLNLQIEQFTDASFATTVPAVAYPLRTWPSERIYMQLCLTESNYAASSYELEVAHCLASPSPSIFGQDSQDLVHQVLILDGCPARSDVHLVDQVHEEHGQNLSRPFRFSFEAVALSESSASYGSKFIYVHCRVRLCPHRSCSRRQHCPSIPINHRVRRAASGYGDSSARHQLSTGPFFLTTDSEDSVQSSSVLMLMVTLGTVAACTSIMAILMAVAWLRSLRVRKQLLEERNNTR